MREEEPRRGGLEGESRGGREDRQMNGRARTDKIYDNERDSRKRGREGRERERERERKGGVREGSEGRTRRESGKRKELLSWCERPREKGTGEKGWGGTDRGSREGQKGKWGERGEKEGAFSSTRQN